MRIRPLLTCVLAATSAAAIPTTAATAAADDVDQAVVSSNWAGYSVTGSTSFSKVSGSWTQPSASCSTAAGDSSFWVGIGGNGESSQALEQIGTSADCDTGTAVTNYAWYELVPQAPVRLPLTISAGDHVSASVSVDGTRVTVSLKDTTTGHAATKTLTAEAVDTSSAEWIAEAPSQCDQTLSSCTPVPLATFGKVTFTDSSATAGGHTGTISDGAWTASPMALSSFDGSSPSAVPTTLTDSGKTFSVSSKAASTQAVQPDSSGFGGGDSGYGYGGGSPYGYGDGPGYGYSGGSSYGGDGGYSSGYGYGGGSPYGDDGGYSSGYGYGGGSPYGDDGYGADSYGDDGYGADSYYSY